MSECRVVTIVHPSCTVSSARAECFSAHHLTILTSDDRHNPSAIASNAHRTSPRAVCVPVRGRGARARFPSLPVALHLINPDVVHLQADPASLLARQVARLCARLQLGLVLETEIAGQRRGPIATLSARFVLARVGALLAPTASALAEWRRIGFRGIGLIAGAGTLPSPYPPRSEARRALNIPRTSHLAGWHLTPGTSRSLLRRMLDAMASTDADYVLLVASEPAHVAEMTDWAGALDVLDRVRFIPLEHAARADAAIDVLIAPGLLPGERTRSADRIALYQRIMGAQAIGVPVVYQSGSAIAEVVGPGGWAVPADDPAMIARLLATTARCGEITEAASVAASAHAARCHSPQAAASSLAQAVDAAREAAAKRTRRLLSRPAIQREPSRT